MDIYGEGDYRRFRITMPDHMDISQMPHPDGRLDRLPFDDVFNLIQLPPGVHQYKVPEDFSERLEPIIQENAARERAMWTQHLRALHPVFTTLHEHFLLAIEQDPDLANGMGFQTWYISHDNARRCNIPRFVEVPHDPHTWDDLMLLMWRDMVDTEERVEFYIVTPNPYEQEQRVAAHVILVQHADRAPRDEVALLLTLFDNGVQAGQPIRFAFINSPTVSHEDLLHHSDRTVVCSWPGVFCDSWYGWFSTTHRPLADARNGYGFTLAVRRAPASAHKTPLKLADLIPEHPPEPVSGIVHLLNHSGHADLPPYIECAHPLAAWKVETELRTWGHSVTAILLADRDVAVCLPTMAWEAQASDMTYLFINEDAADLQGVFLHSDPQDLDELQCMQLLYRLGYTKATIISTAMIWPGFHSLRFRQAQSFQEIPEVPTRTPTPWPLPQPPQANYGPIWHFVHDASHVAPPALVRYDFDIEIMNKFFQGANILNPDLPAIDFPEVVKTAIDRCVPELPRIDRLLIYTDGSSMCKHKHSPAEWVTEFDLADAWAFAVFAEHYATGQIQFLGWTAQTVVHQQNAAHYIGTDYVGSLHSEREALFWAGLWRLGANVRIPTVFLTDSDLAGGQAMGRIGTRSAEAPFHALRSTFQALEAVLPGDLLRVEHVRSHCGDPFNELVDTVAKYECLHRLYVDRQCFDMRVWQKALYPIYG